MTARLPKLSGEQGIGVVVAIATITVTAGLAAALVAGASTFLHTASRDSSNKRALAAAQAGLNVGVYRYGLISASPSASFAEKCVTDREEAWKSTSPHCPVATGYLNDTGASSSYYLTPDMSTSLTGMSTVATECASSGAGDRCLTAIGTVNGVTRRVQERVRVLELFTIHGMLGLEKTQINSSESWSGANFQITSDTGSNGAITFGNNVTAPGAPYHCEVGPSAPAPPCGGQTIKRATPITVPSVETLPFGTTKTTNSDWTITKAEGYNSETRSLSVAAGATVTLVAGDYNFCYVNLGNGATLSAATGARVKVFVDSPSREGSGCTGPSGGKFNAESSGARVNLGATAGQLEFYLWGTATAVASPPPEGKCNADFSFNNTAAGTSSNLYIYAPDSIVKLRSNAYQMGSVVACQTIYWAESASARWDYPPSGIRPSSGVGAVAGSFRECTPTYSGDPESTCG
jgi:hypothetical protein